MSEHSFTLWLHGEVAAARCALLTLYERLDQLKYIEGPRLEKEYMNKIGSYEETVIKEEIECELLREKQQMVQVAINRREPIDEEAIDAKLEGHRQEMLREAAGPAAPDDYPDLTFEQGDELQSLYRDIVKNFHPQTHPELTDAHRQLFHKAQEAYRHRDLAALNLIHAILFSIQEDALAAGVLAKILEDNSSVGIELETVTKDPVTDYSLASRIYCSFKATAEEAALQAEQVKYRQTGEAVIKEMQGMRSQFPFTAAEMLSDPAQIEEYKEELAHRLRAASAERERRTKEIRAMIESVAAHG